MQHYRSITSHHIATRSMLLRPFQLSSTSLLSSLYSSSNLALDFCADLDESEYRQVLFCDDLPCAPRIRQLIDDKLFGDPRQPSSSRFVWDNWFVKSGQGVQGQSAPLPHNEIPGEQQAAAEQVQYSLTRAQCSNILQEDDFSLLIDELTELGNSIGCASLTPPWVSIYTEGNLQNFHTDAPQGPMAWTLSLSKGYGTTFTGGETMLLSPNILDYWRDYDPTVGLETPSIMRFLPPTFGRFVTFDPRIPHGVQQVRGTTNPQAGRIMIHGWFSEPETMYFGDITEEGCGDILCEALEQVTEILARGDVGRVVGFLAVRLEICPGGTIDAVSAVCDTLQADPGDFRGIVGYDEEGNEVLEDAPTDLKLTIREALAGLYFEETTNGGAIVVPFDFL
jgi:hypothetical protein